MDAFDIRQIPQHLGLTQKRLAEELGITLATVGRWECGLREPSPNLSADVIGLNCVPVHYVEQPNLRLIQGHRTSIIQRSKSNYDVTFSVTLPIPESRECLSRVTLR